MTAAFRELPRIAPRLVVAELLTSVRSDAQRGRLVMYDLRAVVLEAATGGRDGLPYPRLERVGALVEQAGGRSERPRARASPS